MNWLVPMASVILLGSAARTLARSLPKQNIAFILACLIAAEVALESLRAASGWPSRAVLFWPGLVIWARIGVRWMFLRWRQAWNYGVWLIILAAAVVALAQAIVALPGAGWAATSKICAMRWGASAFCLFWLSPWFISKLPQQPQQRA